MKEEISKPYLKLTKKIAKSGRSYAFFIPPALVKAGALSLEKKYTIFIVESDEAEEESPE